MSANASVNQANSQHSTGPKTEEGKKKSSLNALRHGLTGQIVVMPSEDLAAYQFHLKSFKDHLQPQGPVEAHLVQSLADTAWRLNRVAALETNLLTLGITHPAGYIAHAPGQIQDALAIASSLESQTKALSNLSMHTQRLSRQFERIERHLRELQDLRRKAEKSSNHMKPLDNSQPSEPMASFFQAPEPQQFDDHRESVITKVTATIGSRSLARSSHQPMAALQ